MIQLLMLWAVFLAFQLVKSKYGHCTKEYLLLFLAQTILCISVTVFFIRAELADLGRPAAEQHGDPEMHEILLGERSGVPVGTNACFHAFLGVCARPLAVCKRDVFSAPHSPPLCPMFIPVPSICVLCLQ